MSYQINKDDIYGFANSVGAEVKEKGKELFFRWCPYCNGNGHDRETFSINIETGAYSCFRSTCGRKGHFVELCRDFGYKLEFENEHKRYKALPQKKIEIRSKAVEYLSKRGISQKVCGKYRITTQTNNDNVLVFPFYDEKNILTCVKYRKTDFVKGRDKCKEWFEKDTKPILFGMAQCENKDRLIITEGQLDSLSLAESGIENAVSVPNGAVGFTWVKHCYDWVEKFNEIVVFGDFENGKVTLADLIIKYFPNKKIRVVKSEDYLGEKDANDILRKYGKTAIMHCIENADYVPVKAVKKLSDVESVDLEKLEHIRTGIYNLDKVINGLYMGQVIVLTGKRGEGKSTLASQIIANALGQTDNEGQPYSVFVYSGELPDYHFKRWLDLQIAGPDNIRTELNSFGEPSYSLKNETVKIINTWYDDRAYIFDNTAVTSEMSINADKAVKGEKISLLATIEQAICRYNIKLILIDNLMTALDVDLSNDLYRAQSNFLDAVKFIAVKYSVAIILIAHPRKTPDGVELSNDSISGSADITNRVDVVLTYSANTKSDTKEKYPSKIGITKNRLTGKRASDILVKYSPATKRIGCNTEECKRIYDCFRKDNITDMDSPPF